MKTVQWVQFLTTMGLMGMVVWYSAGLAIAAFGDGLSFIGVPLALFSLGAACIMIRGLVVGLFGE